MDCRSNCTPRCVFSKNPKIVVLLHAVFFLTLGMTENHSNIEFTRKSSSLDITVILHAVCGKDCTLTIQAFVTFRPFNNMRHSASTMRVSALLHQTPRQLVRTRNPRISEQSLRVIVYNIEQPAVTNTIFLVLQYPPPRIPRLLI